MLSSTGPTMRSPPSSSNSGSGYVTRPIRKSRLRRPPKRPVPTHIIPLQKNMAVVALSLICCISVVSVIPIWILTSMEDPENHPRAVHGVHTLLDMAQRVRQKVSQQQQQQQQQQPQQNQQQQQSPQLSPPKAGQSSDSTHQTPKEPQKQKQSQPHKQTQPHKKKTKPSLAEQQAKPQYTLVDLQAPDPQLDVDWAAKPVARGLSGRDLSQTPAVQGAKRPSISQDCEINVDGLAHWNDPIGAYDLEFVTPFGNSRAQDKEQYITFSPDRGGWNNVRMSMEILFVLAAATGRTLVLPPKEPLYLLNKDHGERFRGFVDFFPLDNPNFPVKIMSMQDFLQTEHQQAELAKPAYQDTKQRILNAAPFCDKRKASSTYCDPLYNYLEQVGYNANFSASHTCLLFDEEALQGNEPSSDAQQLAQTYCGQRRQVYWNQVDHMDHDHIHLPAHHKDYRLLTHFYNMVYFSDPKVGNHFKRFVRDYLHYNNVIYCAAGKVVKAVQKEGISRGFSLDGEGGGAYSAMHVRRGDLQYKKVKIPAKEWYDNTKEVWLDKELLYIATDERNKTFFDDLAQHYELRFLDDYWDLAGLSNLDPNYMGMIDTIVASRGRAFAGTWFSTFTGYINRMRGYHGMTMQDSWYSFLPKKTAVHTWDTITHYAYAFEWPDGWMGIDADVLPNRDKF